MQQRPFYASRLPGARSFLQTEATLAENQPPNSRLFADPYLNCRFAPFSRNDSKAGIPDGKGKNILVRDWKSSYDFVSTGAGFTIRVAPIHPFPVRVHQFNVAGNSLKLNGTTLDPVAIALSNGMLLDPGAQASGFSAASVNSNLVVSGRITTVGYRLVYTGAAASAEGLFIADDVALKEDALMRPDPDAGTYQPGAGGALVAIPAGTVTTAILDLFQINQIPTPTPRQTIVRPENGLQAVLKMHSSSKDQTFKAWHEFAVTAKSDDFAPGSAWTSMFSSNFTAGVGRPGYTLLDEAFLEANIRVTAPGSYRLEVVFCMEQELQLNSNTLDMSKPSPIRNDRLLEVADYLNSVVSPRSFTDAMNDMVTGFGTTRISPRWRPTNQRRQ
jgi:hypothetical protein